MKSVGILPVGSIGFRSLSYLILGIMLSVRACSGVATLYRACMMSLQLIGYICDYNIAESVINLPIVTFEGNGSVHYYQFKNYLYLKRISALA